MTAPVGTERFIFTVATGRCGQASLTQLVQNHVPGCYPAFEEPNIDPIFPPPFATYERVFRRRFVETHELLGRGKVLSAFECGDDGYIDGIVAKRMQDIRKRMKQRHASVYFDISKFFARGLYKGFTKAAGRYALVNLVRDPLANMRSFLNRKKTFTLDNNLPEARSNILRLASSGMSVGEFYLWIWCELYLRYDRMLQSEGVTHAVEIRTEDLTSPQRINAAFDALALTHLPVVSAQSSNTNLQQGLPATRVTASDIELFERFMGRVPANLYDRIKYFKDYNPWSLHAPHMDNEHGPASARA